MKQCFLTHNTSQISYIRFGSGHQTVICFHGYGEESRYFSFLKSYGDRFSFIAIDLPFHGKTKWNEGLELAPDQLKSIINKITEEQNLTGQKISLLGYSLGGRIALSVYESMPETINKLVLLAPDGLKVNSWYWFATQTSLGNALFSSTMKRPQWFFVVLKLLHKLRLVNASVLKFVSFYIDDAAARNILYQRWMVLRKIKPRLKQIKNLISRHQTSVRLILGKHDRIILPSPGERFRKGIEGHCNLSIIDCGHQVLHTKHAEEITGALSH